MYTSGAKPSPPAENSGIRGAQGGLRNPNDGGTIFGPLSDLCIQWSSNPAKIRNERNTNFIYLASCVLLLLSGVDLIQDPAQILAIFHRKSRFGAKPSPPGGNSGIRGAQRGSGTQITGARFLDLCRICASGPARIQQKYGVRVISILFILPPVPSFCCLG